MKRYARTALAVVAGMATLGVAWHGAEAQPGMRTFDVRSPAPPPPEGPELRLRATVPPAQQGSVEEWSYTKPGPPVTPHEPAFVTPAVKTIPTSTTSAVRVGLSGWTVTPLPVDRRERTGGVAFGLTILWGVPVEPKAPAAPEAPVPEKR